MTMPPKPAQPTAPASRPNAAPKVGPAPQIVQPASPPRRGGGIGRFFQTIFLLMLAFGAGYVYMGQEIQADRSEMLAQQALAQERIEALEQELVHLTETRDSANTVEVDLTEVFAPIKAAISRLAEAQMELVAREISTEISTMVETDVQEVNASTAAMPMTSTAETEAAGPAETAITTPPTPVTPTAEEAPPPSNRRPDTAPDDPTGQKPAETSRSNPEDGLVTAPPATSESAPTASNSEPGLPDTSADSGALDLAPTNDSAFSAAPPGNARTPSPASFLPTALDSDVANNLMNKQIPAFLDTIGQITESVLIRMVEIADTAIDHATVSGWIPADSQDGDGQRAAQ